MEKLLVFIVVITLLTGCSSKGEAVPEPGETTEEVATEDLRAEIKDEDYWASLDQVLDLVENTLEERVSFNLSLRLTCQDESEIILDDFYGDYIDYDEGMLMSMMKSEIIRALSTSDLVNEAHQKGNTMEVTGVILKWNDPTAKESSEQDIFSVSDLSGDGTWDYVTKGEVSFAANVKTPTLKNEFGELIGIDEIENKRVKLVEESSPKLGRLAEIALEK